VTEVRDGCFDPTVQSASEFCGEQGYLSKALTTLNAQYQEPTVHLGVLDHFQGGSVTLNSSSCHPIAATAPLIAYGIGAGALGTGAHGTDSVALSTTGGSMVVHGGCDGTGEFCSFTELTSLRVTLSDVSVAGMTVKNIEARLARPAIILESSGVRRIPKALFELLLSGSILGKTVQMSAYPSSDVTINLNPQTAGFSFSASLSGSIAGMNGIPATVTANVSASTANPGASCAGFTPLQTIMGFEDGGWTSAQAQLSVATSPRTQGCYALKVAGSGFMTLNSARFATPLPSVTPTLKLDVFVPAGQPNQYWYGGVQMFASCPSAGLNNFYLGQAELTGKPTGRFSTVSYVVPANVRNVLLGTHNDCSFSVGVNVNPTPTPVVLDNLRFSP
jgi:hypothetical protein